MRVSVNGLYEKFSQVIILIYLPITFFIWYFMLGGQGGGATLILFVAVALFTVFFYKYQKIDGNFLAFLFFLIYCVFYIVFYYAINGDLIDKNGRSLLLYHTTGIALYCISYIVGRNFFKINEKFFIFIFFVMFLRVVYSADLTLLSIDLSSTSDSLKGLYLGLSDIFCIFSLLLVGSVKGEYKKIIIFIISIIALFILNSRASLYIYIFSVSIYFIIFLKFRTISFLLLCFSLFLFFYSSKLEMLFSENNRMFALLALDGKDQSSQERLLLQKNGLNQISNNLVLGDYGGLVKIYNDMGAYIHNILSYWQTYGIIAFFLVVLFLLIQPLKASFLIYKNKSVYEYHYIFILSVYLVLTILFARSYNWYFSWFIVGIIHQFLYIQRKKPKLIDVI
ncbi:O-antigen ligase family protein [Acinetobacter gerneri]|uniref:O-antigen ligase family protein n=1 Tax=Acinetobacter gerneri TaxID=202952 RepID=UPI003AF968DE